MRILSCFFIQAVVGTPAIFRVCYGTNVASFRAEELSRRWHIPDGEIATARLVGKFIKNASGDRCSVDCEMTFESTVHGASETDDFTAVLRGLKVSRKCRMIEVLDRSSSCLIWG